MKAAILQCDRVLEKFRPRFGDYPQMIERMFADAGYRDIEFDRFDCVAGDYPRDLQAYDFYITTGSKADAYGDEPWVRQLIDFFRRLQQHECKAVGICFGHQIMALALGGRVERAPQGWGIGIAVNRMLDYPDWIPEGSENRPEELRLIVSHRDQVSVLPGQGETLIAESDFCPYFVVQWNAQFLSVQGHPEWHRDYARALMEDRRDLYSPEQIEAGLASLEQEPDNHLFTRWIRAFVETA